MNRREALRQIGRATAGLALSGTILEAQNADTVIAGRPVRFTIAAFSPSAVRITILPIENGRAAAVSETGTIVPSRAPVRSSALRVRFSANPPTFHVETTSGQRVQQLAFDTKLPGMSCVLPQGPILGLGEGGPQFDRKGQTFPNRSGQGGYQLATHGGRVPIQWMIGTGAESPDQWAIFIHRPLGTIDLSGTEARFQPSADALPTDIFVVHAKEPATLMQEYARITGFPELPARWTLGYQQSHRTLSGYQSVKAVAQNFRDRKLPCDALIYLGTGFAPSGWNVRQSTTGFSADNTEFTFHPQNFPNPKANIDELHAMHFRVVLHAVIESDNRQFEGTVKDPCSSPKSGTLPVSCYWPYHKPVFDVGVDGWWPDQGDGFDEPSRRLRHRMYWEGSQLWRPHERPYALHRNGAAGMARYAAFLWSGDVQCRWETLKNHVPSGINSGLSGIPYWGFDIGGFIPTPEFTGELFVRWFQLGAFCPLFRSHGRNWHLHLPWGWNTSDPGPQETANYTTDPNELHNADVEPICKKYLELRYRLLPYIYTAIRETHETGMPMIRALWLHHPDDPLAVGRGDEYLWGRDILVAPVVEKGATSRKLYLPRGAWFDFWTEEKIDGGHEIERKVDLATTPLYVRAGVVLPMGPIKQYSDEPVDAPLTLVVFPGADGTTNLYDDDGKTFDHRRGEFMKLQMNWSETNKRLQLRLMPGSRMLPPGRLRIEVRIAGQQRTTEAVFTGRPLEIHL